MINNAAVLREILDAQLEMVCRYRADGTILFVNRAYAATLGKEPDDLIGRSLWPFIPPEDREAVEAQLTQLTPDHVELTIENRLDTAQGTRWTLWRNHALEFGPDGTLLVAQSTGIDITERRELEERTRLLIDELNHRVKNTLMVVQAMAWQTFRGSDVPAEPLKKYNERLAALAAAHTALSQAQWSGSSIRELLCQGTAICVPADAVTDAGDEADGSVQLDGPDLTVPARPTVPLVMVIHELATNAMKYGALSVPGGRVRVSWAEAPEGHLALEWRESGGPPVHAPRHRGFGSRMIATAVRLQLQGEADMAFEPEGLVCRLSFPLDAMAA